MKFFLFLVITISTPLLSFAQKVKIVRVVQADLLELNSGEKVRLANIRFPDSSSNDPGLQSVRRYGKLYLQKEFKNKLFQLRYSGYVDSLGYPLVHLFQKYPLNTLYLNAHLLEKGLGWYKDNADNFKQELYHKAAETAIKRKRGVWNAGSYIPSGFGIYAISLLGGFLEQDKYDYHTVLNDYTLRFAPAEQRSGLELSANLFTERKTGRLCCECVFDDYSPPRRTETFTGLALSFRAHIIGKYAGFSVGGSYINYENEWCSEGEGIGFIPLLSLKLGLMQKVFVSLTFGDFYRRSVYNVGINYIFNNPLNRIWLGKGFSGEETSYGFEGSLNVYRRFLIHVQMGYFIEEYQNRIGARVGLGFVLR